MDKPEREILIRNIRRLCGERNINIKKLMDRSGLSRMTFYHINKQRNISVDTLARIAFVLGVSAEDLLREGRLETTEEKLAVEQLRDLMKAGGPGGEEIRRAVDAAWRARFGAGSGADHIVDS